MAADGLDAPFELGSSAIEAFRTHGFVQLSGVLERETLVRYGAAIDACVEAHVAREGRRPWSAQSTYERAFDQVMNLWRGDERVRSLVFSRRLAQIAAELLEVEGVRLYHDQALFKRPSETDAGGHTPWHADQYYWPLATDRTVTAWIPLHDVPANMGPLEFARGSHRFEDGRELAISDSSEAHLSGAIDRAGFDVARAPFVAGDVSFHLGWTFHRAGRNQTSATRRVMTIIYMDAACRAQEPANPNQSLDLETWLPGVAPGEPAASPLNPQLWPPP